MLLKVLIHWDHHFWFLNCLLHLQGLIVTVDQSQNLVILHSHHFHHFYGLQNDPMVHCLIGHTDTEFEGFLLQNSLQDPSDYFLESCFNFSIRSYFSLPFFVWALTTCFSLIHAMSTKLEEWIDLKNLINKIPMGDSKCLYWPLSGSLHLSWLFLPLFQIGSKEWA